MAIGLVLSFSFFLSFFLSFFFFFAFLLYCFLSFFIAFFLSLLLSFFIAFFLSLLLYCFLAFFIVFLLFLFFHTSFYRLSRFPSFLFPSPFLFLFISFSSFSTFLSFPRYLFIVTPFPSFPHYLLLSLLPSFFACFRSSFPAPCSLSVFVCSSFCFYSSTLRLTLTLTATRFSLRWTSLALNSSTILKRLKESNRKMDSTGNAMSGKNAESYDCIFICYSLHCTPVSFHDEHFKRGSTIIRPTMVI